jgi:broad-specificity NMP kinase
MVRAYGLCRVGEMVRNVTKIIQSHMPHLQEFDLVVIPFIVVYETVGFF